MNSLEFIEKEINYLIELISYHQKEYDKLQYDKGSIMQKFHFDQIKILNDNLMMMEQIKTEIEVLEIIKNRVPKTLILEFVELEEEKNIVKALED